MQPVDPLEEWTTPPFEPTVRDGCLHARGASDDKGQVHFQLAAARHLLAADGRLPVNLKFLVEGEEEAGSPNIEAFLREHVLQISAARYRIPVFCSCTGIMPSASPDHGERLLSDL